MHRQPLGNSANFFLSFFFFLETSPQGCTCSFHPGCPVGRGALTPPSRGVPHSPMARLSPRPARSGAGRGGTGRSGVRRPERGRATSLLPCPRPGSLSLVVALPAPIGGGGRYTAPAVMPRAGERSRIPGGGEPVGEPGGTGAGRPRDGRGHVTEVRGELDQKRGCGFGGWNDSSVPSLCHLRNRNLLTACRAALVQSFTPLDEKASRKSTRA